MKYPLISSVTFTLFELYSLIAPAAEAFTIALKMTSSMTLVPYLLVAAYGLKLAWTGETYAASARERRVDWLRGAIATIYAIGMLIAGGPKFLMLSALLYAPASGRETREYLGEKVREGRERANQAAERGREMINQGRETLTTAIDRGREAYQQARARENA